MHSYTHRFHIDNDFCHVCNFELRAKSIEPGECGADGSLVEQEAEALGSRVMVRILQSKEAVVFKVRFSS